MGLGGSCRLLGFIFLVIFIYFSLVECSSEMLVASLSRQVQMDRKILRLQHQQITLLETIIPSFGCVWRVRCGQLRCARCVNVAVCAVCECCGVRGV
jgi:hypothetical protein